MKILHIAHLAFKITDSEKSLHFYCDLLGMKKRFELYADNGEKRPWITYIKVNENQSIEVFPDYSGKCPSRTQKTPECVGFSSFTVESNDIESIRKNCIEDGIETTDTENGFSVKDPDGNIINVQKSENGYTSIKNVCYGTSDVDKNRKLFCDILGFTDGKNGVCKITDDEMLCFTHQTLDNVSRDDDMRGYMHLSLETDDIIGLHAHCLKSGVNVTRGISMGDDNTYQFWITDTDGNRIEFMEYTEKSFQKTT